MKYYSTNRDASEVNFEEAIFKGLPEDNGLYMPEYIPRLSDEFYDKIEELILPEIAFEVISKYSDEEIEEQALKHMLEDVFNFPIPLEQVEEGIYSLELYHGPTCAFKDVGARFLARSLGYFAEKKGKNATILVATSGDTGSAVANGFLNVPNINVVILYPQGKVSEVQEKQLTTLEGNITAVEINGTFDDCQALVKQAFLDADLKETLQLTSANSINIARLIPQSVYYFWAYAHTRKFEKPLVISVPSGNYGNLSAGLIAFKMGLPVERFIAASNRNDVVPQYIRTGDFNPRASVQTYSNAMDVGNPSNFSRMINIYQNDWKALIHDISGFSLDDERTLEVMRECYRTNGYLLDPHGAIGYAALRESLERSRESGVFLETAHPSKFGDVVKLAGLEFEMPERLEACLHREKKSHLLEADFSQFSSFLLDHTAIRS